MKPRLLLVSGWAHPGDALRPIADALADLGAPSTLAAAEADPRRPVAPGTLLLGWSLGGMLCLETAALQPDRISGLILINTTARFTLARDWEHGLPAAQVRALGRALRNDIATGVDGFLQLSARLRGHAAATAPLARAWPHPTAAALAPGLQYLAETDLRPRLAQIPCPALVVHAREDSVIPLGAGQALAAALPHGRLVVVDDIGHDLPVRAPERVIGAVREFVACNRPSTFSP